MVTYTPAINSPIMVTITATYVGDSSHLGGGISSTLSFSRSISSPTSTTIRLTAFHCCIYSICNSKLVGNNAKWWHDNDIADSEFVKGIQFLIQQKIMRIPETTPRNANQIPSWIKNDAGW